MQVSSQEVDGLGAAQDAGLRKASEDDRQRPRMVLLGMVHHDVVDALHTRESVKQRLSLGWVHGVEENGLLAAPDKIGVVAGALGQWDQGIEQTSVPVDSTHPVDSRPHFARLHSPASLAALVNNRASAALIGLLRAKHAPSFAASLPKPAF